MDGRKIYTLALTHAIGYPIDVFDDLSLKQVENEELSFKGKIKKYIFKFVYIIQSDASLKFIISAIAINCIYERIINT